MPGTVAASVATPGYLTRACALARSLRRHEPQLELFVLLVGGEQRFPPAATLPFTPLAEGQLERPPTAAERFRCGEDLAFALKPALIETLFARGFERVLYLDADTLALAPLEPLAATHEVDRASLADGREPGARVVRDA